jgi:O-antigen/teichoic acid export membrane protein
LTEVKSVYSSLKVMALLTISSKLVRLVILMITARFLTSEDFGVVAAFVMVYTLAHVISGMGVVRTLIQRPIISDKHIGSALMVSLTPCFIVALSLFFFSDVIAGLTSVSEISLPLKIASFTFIIFGFCNVCAAIFQRNGKIVLIGQLQAFGTIFGSIFVTVPLLYFNLGYWAVIIGLLVSELLSMFIIVFLGRNFLFFKIYKKESLEIIKYSFAFFFSHTLTALSQQVDIAIVSRYFGTAVLGNYSRAMQLITFPTQIYLLVVDRVVFPVMSAMKDDKYKLSIFFSETLSVLSLVLCIGVIFLACGAKEIVLIMMGSGWESVSELLSILASVVIFRALTSYMNSFMAAYGIVKVLTYIQMLSLVIFFIIMYVSTPYGIEFLSYGVVLSSFMQFLISVICIRRYTHVNAYFLVKSFLPSIISAVLILSSYFGLYNLFYLNGFVSICIVVVVYLIIGFFKPLKVIYTEKGAVALGQLKEKTVKLINVKRADHG